MKAVADFDRRAAEICTEKDDKKSRNKGNPPTVAYNRKVPLLVRQGGRDPAATSARTDTPVKSDAR
jgi:hypothetical protein